MVEDAESVIEEREQEVGRLRCQIELEIGQLQGCFHPQLVVLANKSWNLKTFLLYKSLFKAWGLNPGYLGYLIEGGLKRTRANISNIYHMYIVDVSSWVYSTNCS